MIRYLRKVYRALFGREPIYLDGLYIKGRMIAGLSWEEALQERSSMNIARKLAWYRGELPEGC